MLVESMSKIPQVVATRAVMTLQMNHLMTSKQITQELKEVNL